jgi:hypothetical protein
MNNVAVITSCSRKLYDLQIYGRCLDTWNHLPYERYMFSEDGLALPGFTTIDLNALCQRTGFFNQKRPSVLARFYRKALPIYWALTNLRHNIIVWLDSDVEVLSPVGAVPSMDHSIASMFYPLPWQEDHEIKNGGIDTGMVWFDMHQLPETFAGDYIGYWHTEKILDLAKPKDTYVLIDLLHKYPMQNLMQEYLHLPSGSNYFDHTIFRGHLYHHIGRGNK